MREGASAPPEVLRQGAFALFWSATTVRGFGAAISGVAVQVLVVSVIAATPTQIGVLNAVGVLPYLALGLVVGALMDRWRRQRALVVTTVGRALVLAAIPVLLLLGVLDFASLAVVLLLQGVLTLVAQSAEQPLLPRLVPRRSLVAANARLGQGDTVAATAGPALAGGLLGLFGPAPVFVVDALLTGVAAVLQTRIRVDELESEPRPPGRALGSDVAEGLRCTYGHPTLLPLALSVHAWFLGQSVVVTLFALFALRHLGVPEWAYGVALAAGGLGGFLGAVAAPRLGARLGAGRAILLGRALAIPPWLVLALVPLTASTALSVVLPVLVGAQLLHGLAMGVEDANDTGYRQSVAPDAIQGRMNATIRTVNRSVLFAGALATGLLVTPLGFRPTIGIAAVCFTVAAVVVAASPLRRARFDEEGR